MGPVSVCGPRPGKSVRSFLISSMVRPGTTALCECIIVSKTTVSPESTFSTGACELSNHPHWVVSRVAGRTKKMPGYFPVRTTLWEYAGRARKDMMAALNNLFMVFLPVDMPRNRIIALLLAASCAPALAAPGDRNPQVSRIVEEISAQRIE